MTTKNKQLLADENKFTHVGVEKPTQKRIALLARVRGKAIYVLLAEWAKEDWDKAKQAGLVTDAMLAHVVGKDEIVEFTPADREKALETV